MANANPFPYEVRWGRMDEYSISFATFAEGLACYRGFNAADSDRNGTCRLFNVDRMDGSEDGNPSGLSDEEREALEEIG